MNLKIFIHFFAVVIITAGCSSFETTVHDGSERSFVAGTIATVDDISNILDDTEAKKPYSRYLYRITGTEKQEGVSGAISTVRGGDENIRFIVTDRELKIILGESFRQSYSLKTTGSERVSFNGGYVADGRLAIMPGLYTPIEFYPKWFPSNADVSVDEKCNFLVRVKKNFPSETQGLVAFIEAQNRLEDAKCEMIGTFDTIPQLKKLVAAIRSQGKYNAGQHYVLRLSWSSTFALVTIIRERGEM